MQQLLCERLVSALQGISQPTLQQPHKLAAPEAHFYRALGGSITSILRPAQLQHALGSPHSRTLTAAALAAAAAVGCIAGAANKGGTAAGGCSAADSAANPKADY